MKGRTQIVTLSTGHHVWTRRVGNGPARILLLHGGPGMTHEYLESLAEFLSPEDVSLYFYDQLGSYYSDQPDDSSLWNMARFKDEVEEVRQALGLEDFYLFGSSWGGFLAIDYALSHQESLKALILSNTTASIRSYSDYITELRSRAPEAVQKKWAAYESQGNYDNEEYTQLLDEYLNNRYICRLSPWPEPVVRSFDRVNQQVYETLHGPNEFFVSGNYKEWDRREHLREITVPTLVLGAENDSMSVADQYRMGEKLPNARVAICPVGSHLSMWDDQTNYFHYLTEFLTAVEAGNF